MARIRARGLSIDFPLYHLGARSLKRTLLAALRRRTARDASAERLDHHRRVRTDDANRVVVSALHDISFEVGSGERVALIGNNGAGKTTLLRTIAGIYEPVGGSVEVEGTVGSLIDVAAGMDGDSTGRENIWLRALYRGMSQAETARLEADVEDFAELGEFLDVPIKGYSAGMSLRLAFAVATAMEPEILLMDEWFMAGDANFMKKAEVRLTGLVTAADILVIATHDKVVVRKWCNRVVRLGDGRILSDGPVESVLAELE